MANNILNHTQLKTLILNRLKEIINEKAAIVKNEIQLAIETRDNETKSNVGDKYETTREMMQLEIEKNALQLNKYELQKNELLKIDINKSHHKVELGSFVFTAKIPISFQSDWEKLRLKMNRFSVFRSFRPSVKHCKIKKRVIK